MPSSRYPTPIVSDAPEGCVRGMNPPSFPNMVVGACIHQSGHKESADDPAPGFMVICYDDDLDLYYTFAAPISADGSLPTEERDFLLAAAEAGKLTPFRGGILYLLNGTFVENPLPMSIIFIPNLTSAASSFANVPNQDQPWLIWEGTPLSNVMMPGK